MGHEGLDTLIGRLIKQRGVDPRLDKAIDVIEDNRVSAVKFQKDNAELAAGIAEATERLLAIADLRQSEQLPYDAYLAEEFFTKVAVDATQGMPEQAEFIVFSGECDDAVPIRSDENIVVVETSYMKTHRLADCYMVMHEIGHVPFDFYLRYHDSIPQLVSEISDDILKARDGSTSDITVDSLSLLIRCWMSEYFADAFAVLRGGPDCALRFHREGRSLGVPPELGSNSHPPDGLRYSHMRKRCLKLAGPSLHKMVQELRKTKVPSRYVLPTEDFLKRAKQNPRYNYDVLMGLEESRISEKLAFDNAITETLQRRTNLILQWAGVEPDYAGMWEATQSLLDRSVPDCDKDTLFGAYLMAERMKPDAALQSMILKTH